MLSQALAMTLAAFEGAPLPDFARRAAVGLLVGGARRRLRRHDPDVEAAFARDMAGYAIAEHVQAANAQHYEVPAAFFERVLGPQLKYSCGYYARPGESLAGAEQEALRRTAENAGLADGQSILELGCGWGSLSLWMARAFPAAIITSVSNSASQRAHIEARAHAEGLGNLQVITADMNVFATDRRFDRVVSVEMFEHMSNWPALLGRARGWLAPDGRLFLHVFSHRSQPYRFDAADPADWIAQHFFTGGVMPSHGLIRRFPELFEVEAEWRWNGSHYARTARDWLANFDAHDTEIGEILADVYGPAAGLWRRRWRLFFLATEGLFGHADGGEWGVSHYRLAPTR
jgi:cyclopropane-fatty-acyl-phospholipid synthase